MGGPTPSAEAPLLGGSSDVIAVPGNEQQRKTFFDHDTERWVEGQQLDASPIAKGQSARDPHLHSRAVYALLILSGAMVSVLTVLVVSTVKGVSNGQVVFTQAVTDRYGTTAAPCAWVAYAMLVTAAAFLLTHWCPQAVGSGIPEVKVEIRGLRLQDFFVGKVLVAKAIGLALSQGAGLPVGREGPFVHFAACVSNLLLRSPLAGPKAPRLRPTMLVASVAVGVGAAFSVPIAGVLFALEMLPDTAWHNTTYWSCLGMALAGSVTSRMINAALASQDAFDAPLLPPVLPQHLGGDALADPSNRPSVLACAVLLGAVMGWLGHMFIRAQQALNRSLFSWRMGAHVPKPSHFVWQSGPGRMESAARLGISHGADEERPVVVPKRTSMLVRQLSAAPVFERMSPRTRGLLICLSVAGLNASISWLLPPLRELQVALLGHLFSAEPLAWESCPVLALALLSKLVTTALALSLPLPNGCIAPVYVLGALGGRLFGLLVFNAGLWGNTGDAGLWASHFSLVGAAAFSAAVCRSFSMAVAIYELAPLLSMELPIAAAALVAIVVANQLGPSIFDAVLAARRLPAMLQFRTFHFSLMPVSEVMRTELPTVRRFSDCESLDTALREHPRTTFFVIVNSYRKLLGAVTKSQLMAAKDWLEAASPEQADARLKQGHFAAYVTEGKVVDLCHSFAEVDLDVSPMQVPPKLSLQNLAVLFTVHGCEVAFVTERGGVLLGMVQAADLLELQA